jgi:hypothetical protein
MGEIVVEQTFDLTELKDVKVRIKAVEDEETGSVDAWTRREGGFGRSSEEELVEVQRPVGRRK